MGRPCYRLPAVGRSVKLRRKGQRGVAGTPLRARPVRRPALPSGLITGSPSRPQYPAGARRLSSASPARARRRCAKFPADFDDPGADPRRAPARTDSSGGFPTRKPADHDRHRPTRWREAETPPRDRDRNSRSNERRNENWSEPGQGGRKE